MKTPDYICPTCNNLTDSFDRLQKIAIQVEKLEELLKNKPTFFGYMSLNYNELKEIIEDLQEEV